MSQRPLESESWFYPKTNRAKAEANLNKYGRDGSFLIRECENPKGVFVLSYRHAGKILHSKIDVIGQKQYRIAGGRKFDSVSQLVTFYMAPDKKLSTDSGSVVQLSHPSYERDRTQLKWYYSQLNDEVANTLLRAVQVGDYLLRESATKTGDLTLSVKQEQAVLNFTVHVKEPGGYTYNGKAFDTVGHFIDACFTESLLENSGVKINLRKPVYKPEKAKETASSGRKQEVNNKQQQQTTQPLHNNNNNNTLSHDSQPKPTPSSPKPSLLRRRSSSGASKGPGSPRSDSTGSDHSLDNTPLYQVYHRDAVTRHIVTQASDESADTKAGRESQAETVYDSAMVQRRLSNIMRQTQLNGSSVGPGSRQSCLFDVLKHGFGPINLWRDIPEVQNSGVLKTMDSSKMKLQEALFEIITSEASYLKSLNILLEHFYNDPSLLPTSDKAVISKQNHRVIFSNVSKVQAISKGLLQRLRALKKKNIVLDPVEVATTISDYAKENFEAYIAYTKNQNFQERELTKLRQQNQAFNQALLALEKHPRAQMLPFTSFLLLPVQRITRMPLLLDSALSKLDQAERGYQELKDCFCLLQKIVVTCNEEAKRLADIEQVAKISDMLDFKTTKTLALVSQNRHLVKEGQMTALGPSFFGAISRKPCPIYVFLFNDVMVITKQKGQGSYEVLESFPRGSVTGEVLGDDEVTNYLPHGAPPGHPYLIFLEVKDKKITCFLSCESLSDQLRWEEALAPVSTEATSITLFDETDCPQAQALQTFVATQPDELTLEEGDIVNVTLKSPDGWWRGCRLHDNKAGWFPSKVVVEIQSAHMRERNRRQQYRLMFSVYRQSGEFVC